jgi:hypothetical protein
MINLIIKKVVNWLINLHYYKSKVIKNKNSLKGQANYKWSSKTKLSKKNRKKIDSLQKKNKPYILTYSIKSHFFNIFIFKINILINTINNNPCLIILEVFFC